MTYAIGWERTAQEPDVNGEPGEPHGVGPRHAVHRGTREALCGARLVHVDPDGEFGPGGLGESPCESCLALAA